MNDKLNNALNDYRNFGIIKYNLSLDEVEQQIGNELENPTTYNDICRRIRLANEIKRNQK